MSNIENELRSQVNGFVSELSNLIRQHALATAQQVLSHGAEGAPNGAGLVAQPAQPERRKRGRPRKVPLPVAAVSHVAPAAHAAPAAAAAAPARPRGRPRKSAGSVSSTAKRALGEKRSPIELAQLTEKTFEYIKANPGQGVEQISKSLGTPTKDLTLPLRKLLLSKKATSKGVKRATRYYPRS
jgi:hypothetical protein